LFSLSSSSEEDVEQIGKKRKREQVSKESSQKNKKEIVSTFIFSPEKIIYLENSRYTIALFQQLETICFHGKMKIRVLSGFVNIHGHVLPPSKQFFSLYAPYNKYALIIKGIQGPKVEIDDDEKISLILRENSKNYASIVLFESSEEDKSFGNQFYYFPRKIVKKKVKNLYQMGIETGIDPENIQKEEIEKRIRKNPKDTEMEITTFDVEHDIKKGEKKKRRRRNSKKELKKKKIDRYCKGKRARKSSARKYRPKR